MFLIHKILRWYIIDYGGVSAPSCNGGSGKSKWKATKLPFKNVS